VDAGWDEATKIAGIGIIIRNHLGQPVLSEWWFVPNCVSAEEAEMMACLGGIKHLVGLQRGPAIVESDCLRVIQTISTNEQGRTSSWALVNEAKDLLRIYEDMTIKKVDRLHNGVAHVLAQLGKSGLSGVLRGSALE
jgi:ribonuclease HI